MLNSATSTVLSRRTLLGAKIVFNDGSSIFDCTVRSLSGTGAELHMKSALYVPDAFKLMIKPFDDMYCCQVSARSATSVQVAFLSKVVPRSTGKKKAPASGW